MIQSSITSMRGGLLVAICCTALFASAPAAFCQETTDTYSLSDIAKDVVLDPTTFAPAGITYAALRLDWRSSQVFFRNGYVEANPRYTTSGLSNDWPVSYREGNRRIAKDALWIVQMSAANNAMSRVMERVLIQAHPEHRKLLRTLGWIERTAFASYWASRLSAAHFAKWQENGRVARRLGYR